MAKKDFALVKNKPASPPPPADPPSGPSPEFHQRVAQLEYANLRSQVTTLTGQVLRVMAERDATRELATGLQQEIDRLTAKIAKLEGKG